MDANVAGSPATVFSTPRGCADIVVATPPVETDVPTEVPTDGPVDTDVPENTDVPDDTDAGGCYTAVGSVGALVLLPLWMRRRSA